MNGLESLVMSDLEMWITLIAFGVIMLAFAPTPGGAPRHSSPSKRAMLVLLLVAALGGLSLAWYALPALTSMASATSGLSGG